MTTQFINYSEAYYAARPSMPEKQYGKFVVLQQGQETVCIFAAIQQAEFHANIVERFAKAGGLHGYYNDNRDIFYFSEKEWEIKGGGHWQYEADTQQLALFGKSLAYGYADIAWVLAELKELRVFNNANIISWDD